MARRRYNIEVLPLPISCSVVFIEFFPFFSPFPSMRLLGEPLHRILVQNPGVSIRSYLSSRSHRSFANLSGNITPLARHQTELPALCTILKTSNAG